MNTRCFFAIVAISIALPLNQAQGQKYKKDVLASIDTRYEAYASAAHEIWELAELGYQEYKVQRS